MIALQIHRLTELHILLEGRSRKYFSRNSDKVSSQEVKNPR